LRKSLKILALEDEVVDCVDEEAIEEVSKAAGVSSNGNVRGDDEVDEADEVSVDESEVDNLDDLDDRVEAADEEEDPEFEEYLDENDFFAFFSAFLFKNES
jgi:hypothetical protein